MEKADSNAAVSAREQALYCLLSGATSAAAIKSLLSDLCTPAEVEAMADRWWVVLSLQRGLSYREVHAETGVSVVTIGRVARALARGDGGYQQALARLALSENNE